MKHIPKRKCWWKLFHDWPAWSGKIETTWTSRLGDSGKGFIQTRMRNKCLKLEWRWI